MIKQPQLRWFSALLLVGLILAGVWPGAVQPLTDRLEPRLVVGIALFLTSWSLESRKLWQAMRRPFAALWAFLISQGLLPALAWLAGLILGPGDWFLGLQIIASVPCTLASAVIWTRSAGGNDATALLTVLLTTSLSWLTTTTWLAFTTGQTVGVDTASMMRGLAVVLLLPVGLGQVMQLLGLSPRNTGPCSRWSSVAARLLVLSILLKALVEARLRMAADGQALPVVGLLGALAAALGVHLSALGFGLVSGRWLGFPRPDCVAIAFAGSQKTLPVALYIFETFYREASPLAIVP